jgi:magnesium chelatase subunit I
VPSLLNIVRALRLADAADHGTTAAACELVLEALVARKKISRSDAGQYGRAVAEKRRRPSDDF